MKIEEWEIYLQAVRSLRNGNCVPWVGGLESEEQEMYTRRDIRAAGE